MTYYELAQAIDRVERKVSPWEANFLESMLQHGPCACYTPKQEAKLRELGERYLPFSVMAEFNGQQVLPL